MKYPMDTWTWHGLPGHLCVSDKCIFRLHTKVGPYKISTVGAYYPVEGAKRMTPIGCGRDYETYIFVGDSLSEIDGSGINLKEDANDDPCKADELAAKMHMEFCKKYASGEFDKKELDEK